MKKSIAKRLTIKKSGKIIRRPMGVDHFRAHKSSDTKQQLRKNRSLQPMDRRALRQEGITI